jgi:drug/metabolite transporter (DMT)-like permease
LIEGIFRRIFQLNDKLLAIFKATFAVFIWGVSFVATKIALRYVSPVTVVWLRFGIGIIVLAGAVYVRKQFKLVGWKDALYFLLLGFIGITFHQWLQSNGLVTSQATTTAWIVATTPIFMALLGWIALKESLNWLQVAGVFLAALGVILVVTKGDLTTLSKGQFGSPGDILILISSLNWAVFSVLSRRGLKTFPPALMMLYVMLFGWLLTSILFFAGPGLVEVRALPWQGWVATVLILGIFSSGFAYIFWYDALSILPVAQTGAFVYLEPFVTAVVAAFLLNETLGLLGSLGGMIILVGIWLVNRTTKKN